MRKLNEGDVKIFDIIKAAVKEASREEGWVTKVDIKHLPTKQEYYKREDQTMGELKKIEEELTILSQHSADHSDRIKNLEKIHKNISHSSL